MKKLLLPYTFILLFAFTLDYEPVRAQGVSPNWAWSEGAGSAGSDIGSGIAVDGAGNSYVAGSFMNTISFGTFSLQSSGGADIFIVKYNPQGSVVWAKKAGGTGNDYGREIAVDGNGNVYATGHFTGTATFGVNTVSSSGANDIFIVKYDAQGNPVWVKKAGGSGADIGRDIAVRIDGTGYVIGDFSGSANFGSSTLNAVGEEDMFFWSFDAQGNTVWAKSAGSTNTDIGRSIAIGNAGDLYVTGHFSNTISFNTTDITSNGSDDIYLTKYNLAGDVIWAKAIGGTGMDYGRGIALDNSGNIIATGHFHNTVNFGATTLTSGGGYDLYIAKFDSLGNNLWAKSAPGAIGSHSNYVVTDANDNSYITGSFGGTVSFQSASFTSAGGFDSYVAKYNPSGDLTWVKVVGGTANDEAHSIAVDVAGNAYITGEFHSNNVSFGSDNYATNGNADIFFAKLGSVVIGTADEFTASETLRVYPNPTPGNFVVSFSDAGKLVDQIQVLDGLGRQVYTAKNINSVNLNHLLNGIYVVRVFANEAIYSKQLIIQK